MGCKISCFQGEIIVIDRLALRLRTRELACSNSGNEDRKGKYMLRVRDDITRLCINILVQ